MNKYGTSWFVAMLLAVALGACAEEDADAIVDVRWAVGGATCARVGIDRIEVALVDSRDTIATAQAQCDAGTVAVTGVPAGTYTAQVFGYRSGSENPAYIGLEAGVVVPKGGRVSSSVIFLQEAPGAIDLTWRFESGALCRFEGIEWVQVSAFDERNRVVADLGLPCDPGSSVNDGLGGPGFEYLEDANGVVLEYLFSGPHEVVVYAFRRASDASPEWAGSGTATVESFELSPLDVVLEPCSEDPDSICF